MVQLCFTAFLLFCMICGPISGFSFEIKTNPYDYVLAHDGKEYKQFKDLDLSGKDFSGKTLQNVHFYKCNFTGANFSGAKLIAVSLKSGDGNEMTGVNFKGATLINSWVSGNDLNLEDAIINYMEGQPNIRSGSGFTAVVQIDKNGSLKNSRIYGGYLSGDFENTDFHGMKLKKGTLKMDKDVELTNFDNVEIVDSTVWHFNLTNKKVKNIVIAGSRISSAILRGAQIDNLNLAGSELSYLDFREASIKKADFTYSKSSQSKFQNAVLRESDFSNTNFSGDDFQNADLHKARFINAKLNRINFNETDLSNADFSKAEKMDTCTFLNANIKDTKS